MQNLHKYLAFTCIILLFAACRKEDSLKDKDGVVVSQPPIWATATTDDDSLSTNNSIRTKVQYNDGLVISSRRRNKNLLRMIDMNTGGTKWEWNDFIKYFYSFNIRSFAQKENSFTFFDYNYLYQVDLSNGKTVFKNEQYEQYRELNSIQDKIFTSYQINKDGALREEIGRAHV